MLVNASLLSVDTVGDEQIAQVYFNVLLREDPSQEAPIDVRENLAFRPPPPATAPGSSTASSRLRMCR